MLTLIAFIKLLLAMLTGQINLSGIPTALGTELGISTFAAGLLASAFLLLMFDLPIIIFSKNQMLILTMTILVLSLDVAISWLPYFTLIIIIVMIALLFAEEMRGWITGRGEH